MSILKFKCNSLGNVIQPLFKELFYTTINFQESYFISQDIQSKM